MTVPQSPILEIDDAVLNNRSSCYIEIFGGGVNQSKNANYSTIFNQLSNYA
jgi:hypothetical protein